jgi:hypothetical protein
VIVIFPVAGSISMPEISTPAASTALVARITSVFLNLEGLRIRILKLIRERTFTILGDFVGTDQRQF